MNIFCTLSGIAKLALFCLSAGVVIGVLLNPRPTAVPVDSSRYDNSAVIIRPPFRAPMNGEEVSQWRLTRPSWTC
jgi:hypothetical protein